MSLRAHGTNSSSAPDDTSHPNETESIEAAEAAGLRYVHDRDPGFTRKRAGKKGFSYLDHQGRKLRDKKVVKRIEALKIPPAWENVWICTRTNGHLQCTGRDARGRKQYLYHPNWRQFRDQTKFTKMISFGEKLPAVRRQIRKDLAKPGLSREKVLATVVAIMDEAHIRVGNDEYAKTNDSYGLTTLKHQHARVRGSKVVFHFRGKSGVVHDIAVDDPKIARVVRKCDDLPGKELFAYRASDGRLVDVTSSDVNEYLKSIAGHEFTAKDFRTWGGSVIAACCLLGLGPCSSERAFKKSVLQSVKETAEKLGNTVSVCRKYYIHPAINESYQSGTMFHLKSKASPARGLKKPEAFLMLLLKTSLRGARRAGARA